MSSAAHDALGVAGPIFANNPYEGHPALSPLEAEVLWEYAKLAQHVKTVRIISLSQLELRLTMRVIACNKDPSTCGGT